MTAAAAHLVESVDVHRIFVGLRTGKVVSSDNAETIVAAIIALILRELRRGGQVPAKIDGAGSARGRNLFQFSIV
jgi:hypothetical protein